MSDKILFIINNINGIVLINNIIYIEIYCIT